MGKFNSDYTEKDKKSKQKNPKFRDYYDEEFSEEDEIELNKRRKKLGKKPKRKKDQEHDWSTE